MKLLSVQGAGALVIHGLVNSKMAKILRRYIQKNIIE
jgi:hypothetical protein